MPERACTISVIIPHLNQPEMLARCLGSVMEGARLADEVIVVDNGSAEPPGDICARYPEVTLLSEAEPGPGPARNRGISAARGDVLAFIDADCIADRDWLAAAEEALSDPDARILGGDVRIAYADPARLTVLEAYESIYAYRMDRYIRREGYTGTGNLVIRRDVFERVGPFAGIGVAEDRDWGRRATALGFRINYVPDMRVYHPARRSFRELRHKWDRHIAHEYASARDRRGGRARFLVKALAMGISPLAELPRLLFSDRIGGPASRLKALAGLARIRAYRARVMLSVLLRGNPERLSSGWNRTG